MLENLSLETQCSFGPCVTPVPLYQLHLSRQSDSDLSVHPVISGSSLVISFGKQKSPSGMSSFPVDQAQPSASQVVVVSSVKQKA